MREIRTSGSMSGDGKRSVAAILRRLMSRMRVIKSPEPE